MRALVTGISGFAGTHLKNELEQNGYEVYGLNEITDAGIRRINICDHGSVCTAIKEVDPDAVFHLAAQSMAARSWLHPQETLKINIVGTTNLLEAVREIAPKARVLLVGSADQYGLANHNCAVIDESMPLSPKTPYAVSKCAQEYLGQMYAATYGMQICMTRTFSYGGSGHPKGFVLSDFASGIADVEAGKADSLRVGNLDSERDFTHIKDIVRAYRLLNERGIAGEVYNVGSGEVYSIREILQHLLDRAVCDIPVVQADSQKRPKDVRGAACNHDKLTALTGWVPEKTIEEMIEDELEYWRRQTHML